jgi:hypothetical protein
MLLHQSLPVISVQVNLPGLCDCSFPKMLVIKPLASYGCLICGFRCFSSQMSILHWYLNFVVLQIWLNAQLKLFSILPIRTKRRYWHHAFIASSPASLSSVNPRQDDDSTLTKRPEQGSSSPTSESHRNQTGPATTAVSTRNSLTLLVQSRHSSRLIATFKDKNIAAPGSKNWSVSW